MDRTRKSTKCSGFWAAGILQRQPGPHRRSRTFLRSFPSTGVQDRGRLGNLGLAVRRDHSISQRMSEDEPGKNLHICKFRNTEKKCKVSVILFQSTLLLADYRGVKSLDLESFQLREIVSFPEGRVGSSIGCVFLELKPSSDLGVYYFSGGWIRLVFADK